MIADFVTLLKYFFKEDIRKTNKLFLLPWIGELFFTCFLNPFIVFLLTMWCIPFEIMWLCLVLYSATFLVFNLGASINKISISFLFPSLKTLGISQILLLIIFDLKLNVYKFLGTLLLLMGLIYKMKAISNIFIVLALLLVFISGRICLLNYLIKKKKTTYFLSGIDHYLDYSAILIGILLFLNNIKVILLISFSFLFLRISANLIKKYTHSRNYNFIFLQKLMLELKISLYEMGIPIVNDIFAILIVAGFGVYVMWLALNMNHKFSQPQYKVILYAIQFGTMLFQVSIFDHYCFFPLTEISKKKMHNLRFLGEYIQERYLGKLKIHNILMILFLLIICFLELFSNHYSFVLLYFSILLSLGESYCFFYTSVIFQKIVQKLPMKFRRIILIIPCIFGYILWGILLKLLNTSIHNITKIFISSSLVALSIFIFTKLARFILKETEHYG
ncbi:MAG: hypothetical protein LBF32_04895 [Streptococcaceae bacterium]|jgi:hypothetical protein|nr:hypothetical protein [Streptococcaceae bacterium]